MGFAVLSATMLCEDYGMTAPRAPRTRAAGDRTDRCPRRRPRPRVDRRQPGEAAQGRGVAGGARRGSPCAAARQHSRSAAPCSTCRP